ncbi:MAG: hypothetical protein ACLSE6_07665 [Alphaproteobacteria bacterium]
MMKVAIIGTLWSADGHRAQRTGKPSRRIDKIEEKIRSLRNGKATIYEDGMEDLFQKNLASAYEFYNRYEGGG